MDKPSKLLINEPPLQVLPTLAQYVGLGEAIVLQQLHYWLQNPKVGVHHNGRKWVRNSVREWQADNFPFWHVNTISRLLDNLEGDGLIARTTELNRAAHDKTWWYAIRYENLGRLQSPVERVLRVQKSRQNDDAFHQNGGRQNEPPFHQNGGGPSTKMVEGSAGAFHQNGGTYIHRENTKSTPETTVVPPLGDEVIDAAQAWRAICATARQRMDLAAWRDLCESATALGVANGVLTVQPMTASRVGWFNLYLAGVLDGVAADLGYTLNVRAAFPEATP